MQYTIYLILYSYTIQNTQSIEYDDYNNISIIIVFILIFQNIVKCFHYSLFIKHFPTFIQNVLFLNDSVKKLILVN